MVNAGARLDQLFWMTLNDINDVQNAVRATTLVPAVPDDNTLFLRGVQLLAEIDDRGGAEIGFSTSEDPDDRLRPDPRRPGAGRDLLGAAKDGYVFRAKGDGRMALYKREKELTLKIRPPFTHSPEMDELAEIFHLTPGLSRYKIKSELQPERREQPAGRARRGRHDLPQLAVGPPDHDLPVQGGLRPRGTRPRRAWRR